MAIERILQLKDLDWMRGISLQASSPLGGIFSQASNFDPFEVMGMAQPSLAGTAATGDALNTISFLTMVNYSGNSYLYGHANSKLFQITFSNVVTDITTASGIITTSSPQGARVTKGWFTDLESTNMPTVGGTAILTSLTAPQFTTIELGHATQNTLSASGGIMSIESVAIPTISSTHTLTNKRITKRVVTTTDDATSVIDVDVTDVYELSAVANATTFSTTGTPTDGQPLVIRFKDAGVAKGLTWDAVFVAIGTTAPTTTVAGKWHYVMCQYNSAATKWHILSAIVQA